MISKHFISYKATFITLFVLLFTIPIGIIFFIFPDTPCGRSYAFDFCIPNWFGPLMLFLLIWFIMLTSLLISYAVHRRKKNLKTQDSPSQSQSSVDRLGDILTILTGLTGVFIISPLLIFTWPLLDIWKFLALPLVVSNFIFAVNYYRKTPSGRGLSIIGLVLSTVLALIWFWLVILTQAI